MRRGHLVSSIAAIKTGGGSSFSSGAILFGGTDGKIDEDPTAFSFDKTLNQLTVSSDAASTHILGQSKIGSIADAALFGHFDSFGAGTAAVKQSGVGFTTIQAASGQAVSFEVGGTSCGQANNTAGIPKISPNGAGKDLGATGDPWQSCFLSTTLQVSGPSAFLSVRTAGSALFDWSAANVQSRAFAASQATMFTGFVRADINANNGIRFGRGRLLGGATLDQVDTYSPETSVNGRAFGWEAIFSPTALAPNWACLEINPTINGTSTGKATGLAIASKTNVLTGGTIRLLDLGTTTTDYFTGYSQVFAVNTLGDTLIGGALDHDGPTVGLFGVAPAARAAAYTQTYATASRIHAARTADAITDNTLGTASLSIGDTPSVYDEAYFANALASLIKELNDLRIDQQNTAQVLNQAIDDLQSYGLLQ